MDDAATWAIIAIAALQLAREADNQLGRAMLTLLGCFLLGAALVSAPWGGLAA